MTNRSLHDSTMEDSALILFHISVSLNTTDTHLGVSGVSKNWEKYEKYKFSGQHPPKIDENQKNITSRLTGKNVVQFVVDGRPHNDYF